MMDREEHLRHSGVLQRVYPNVVVEWCGVTLLRIREVPGSILGPETGYPE
jgi:hypothetical protein